MRTEPIEVDIIFDSVCPWCYIGKRRFEEALKLRPHLSIKINWRSFMLNPDMPRQGMDRQSYLSQKFGGEARAQKIYGSINSTGKNIGIEFAFDQIKTTPNSIDSHRLVHFAQRQGLASEVVEDIFIAYFLNGQDIGNHQILADIGEKHGLERKLMIELFKSDTGVDQVLNEHKLAHQHEINGVPAYIFNSNMLISGAQEPAVITRMIDVAAQKVTS